MNFWAGKGLTSYDGGLLILWPPLYPVLLGLVHGIFGLDMLAAANAIQIATFAALSICLAILFVRIFEDNFVLAIAASVLADVGAVVLVSFDTAGSDYLGLFLVVLFVLLAGRYVESGSPRAFAGLAVVGMLAVLNRYLGIALLVAGVLAILLWARTRLRKRLASSAALGATALPGLLWLVITSRLYTRRPPISFSENFDWFSRSILGWFFEARDLRHAAATDVLWLWLVILGLVLLVLLLRPQRGGGPRTEAEPPPSRAAPNTYLAVLLLAGLCYVVILFGAASMAYFNKLGGRFLLPLYVPLICLPVVAAGGVLRRAREGGSKGTLLAASAVSYAFLGILALLLLQVSIPVAIQSHAQGAAGGENAFNTRSWDENAAIRYWRDHVPLGEYVLLSNQPDGVAFQTQHPVGASPRKTSGPYGTVEYPLDSYARRLFPAGAQVYLLWIEPNPCTYCYAVEDLSAIARVEPLSVSDDGGVYRLQPK
jgi:4-amino-4-deoxy-L-arabinose transferase-like glycosyltransferase